MRLVTTPQISAANGEATAYFSSSYHPNAARFDGFSDLTPSKPTSVYTKKENTTVYITVQALTNVLITFNLRESRRDPECFTLSSLLFDVCCNSSRTSQMPLQQKNQTVNVHPDSQQLLLLETCTNVFQVVSLSKLCILCHIQTINPIEYIFLSSNNYTGIDHNKINTKLNTKINNTKINNTKINNNKINTKLNTKINNTKINNNKINTKINNTKLNTKINNTKINNTKLNTKINNTKINTKINNNNDNKNNNDDTCWRLQLRIEQPLWPPCHHRQQVPLPPHRQSKVCAVQSVGTVLREALPSRPQVERQHPNVCLLRHLLQPQQNI